MDAHSPEEFLARYGTTERFFPPPLTDEEAERLYGDDPEVGEKVRQDDATSGKPKTPRIIDPSTLYGLVVPVRRWIVPEWFPYGHATLNYGDGGVGKTLLAQQLMTSCATARPWCGLGVEQCRVFGFFCEDDADELHRRQVSICEAYGLSLADLGDMRWISGVGEDNLLVTFDQQGRLQLTARYAEILKGAKDFGAKMVVIDTAADTFGGNENDRSQVRQFIGTALNRLAKEIDGAVLLNAHPSRSGMSATGDMDGGSTGWSNSARSRWSLSRPKGEDGEPADTDERLMTRRKANYASIGDTIKLRWQNGVLVPAYAPVGLSAMAERSRADIVFLELLAKATAEGRTLSDSKASSSNYAPKLFASRPDRQGLRRHEFEAAMQRLFSTNKIRMIEYGRLSGRGVMPRKMVAVEAS
jgi:RecA-family ATPase